MRPRSWKILRWLNQSTHSRVNWFEVVESTPWSPVADQFGLVEADDRLGQGVIEAVASGSDRGHRSVLGEPFGVTDSEVLHPTVGVVDQPLQDRPLAVPFPDRLLQRIQRQVGLQGTGGLFSRRYGG